MARFGLRMLSTYSSPYIFADNDGDFDE